MLQQTMLFDLCVRALDYEESKYDAPQNSLHITRDWKMYSLLSMQVKGKIKVTFLKEI